jgi:phage baseplate assembly protein W
MNNEKDFLGTGWSFPPAFSPAEGVAMVSGREDIEQSLGILLSTTIGERVMEARFGCNLASYQFESMDSTFIGLLRDTVYDAILYHEARIRVESIRVTEDLSPEALSGQVIIDVSYRIRATNSRYNYVYDFYLTEGVNPQ